MLRESLIASFENNTLNLQELDDVSDDIDMESIKLDLSKDDEICEDLDLEDNLDDELEPDIVDNNYLDND